ncbi:MAG: response regulator [Flavobacteriales bacterium]|nr:response regulator [Flavobacteriales bacterium]
MISKVILIDDSKSVNAVNRELLLKNDVCETVESFTNGQDALDHLEKEENHSDLILLDIYMPGMTGFDFLKRLDKIISQRESRPIIAMLTQEFVSSDYMKSKDEFRADEYLKKPLEIDDIEDLIEQYFD